MISKKKLKSFEKKGIITLDEILDKNECDLLLEKLKKTRDWSTNLFRSKEDFEKDPQMKKTNPGRGVSNLAEEYNLDFIEKNAIFIDCLNKLVGKDYEIILKKFVIAVPESWVPNWLKKIISKKLVANLGPYIKKEFRNVTYFRGIDYHMDLIDHPGGGDYVTAYVYLNDVDLNMSPLHLIESSHEFGPTKFPHFIRNDQKDRIDYGIDEKNYKKYNKHILTGKKGTVYCWSSMTLHGTKPTVADKQRISLRYTIKKNKENYNNNTLIDNILHNVGLNKGLNVMRDDIDWKSKNYNQVKFDKVLK